jgi:hypothetical protein
MRPYRPRTLWEKVRVSATLTTATSLTRRTRAGEETKEEKHNSLSENEDKDHTNEHPRLLSDTPDTRITDDSDRESSGETSETDRETGTELDETGVEGHGGLELAGDEDRDDEAVNLPSGRGGQ